MIQAPGTKADPAMEALRRFIERRALGDAARAKTHLARARRLGPGNAAVRWASAVFLREQGRLREALAECGAAEKLGGGTADWLSFRADVESEIGLPMNAALTSRRAAALDPGNADRRVIAARRLQAASFFRGALREAEGARTEPRLVSALREFLASSPADPPVEPKISVDPRLELLAVVAALAARAGAPSGFEFGASKYGLRAARRFEAFRFHDAVKLYRESLRAGLTPIGAQRSLLALGFPPALKARQDYRRSDLLDALRDFAARADFNEFFGSERSFYRELIRAPAAQARRKRLGALFKEYTGLAPRARYDVLLCPLYGRANPHKLNCVLGPGLEPRCRIYSTVAPPFDYESLRWSLWHELGHALSDHWLEHHLESLQRSRGALTAASAKRYGWWGQVVREHVVQGLATRLEAWAIETGKISGPQGCGAGDNPLPYLPKVVAALARYDAQRRRFQTLADFYPNLMRLFEGLARRRRPAAKVPEGRSLRAQSDGLN